MSTTQSPPVVQSEEPRPPKKNGWRRRSAGTQRPGASVIGRGEPMLWLTAGALAVAIFMIIGLITLVVIMGGKTFWPARLVEWKTSDGRTLLGEISGDEVYEISRERAETMPEGDRARVLERMGDADEVLLSRTLLRVDNKEINGQTYVWVDDLGRVASTEAHPTWAMTLERLSWGRFVGMPRRFVQEVARPVSGTEAQLTSLVGFLEENAGAFEETDAATIEGALTELREELETARQRGTEVFLESVRKEGGAATQRVILESGEETPLANAASNGASNGAVRLVRRTYEGETESYQEFRRHHREVLRRSREIRSIEHHGLGELSDRLELSRMATVRAGLDIGAALEPIAIQLAERDMAREGLTQAVETRGEMVAALDRRFGQGGEVARLVAGVIEGLNASTRAEIQAVETAIAELEESIPAGGKESIDSYRAIATDTRAQVTVLTTRLETLEDLNKALTWEMVTADGTPQNIAVSEVVRAYPANQLSVWGRFGVYFDRWREFLLDEPREANMEGGVFPAIWGTVAMTLIMTVAVVPFGVLAALYLREYAKAGPIVSAVRIAVNNLAGVPSIVFGVFGLGFFCYVVGAQVDELLYPEYVAQNKPVFETGGLLWASLTLALLTLPVVIVATEEALAAVPNSMREGSYACGASKWQTIWRIILPRALPGIMTGMILAMARGAGEVAPLMLVGAVKIAPTLPVDWTFPYLHPNRSFMHLGFHIYDLGFQSPDSEAAKPMVFTTTLLLITIVAFLNVSAILIRSRLRRRFASSQF